MGLFRKLFYKKPPDGLLEICERVHVFDCCFSIDAWEEETYKVHVKGIVHHIKDHFPDASFLVFNFREGETRSFMSDLISDFDMTIMDYPRQYQGCPLIGMELLHHFLRSCESWLSLDKSNLLLMHCERGAWPVLAFVLAALLIYRKQYNGEQKTLDMIYKQAPTERLRSLLSLNPISSQLRYLQYVSRRNVAMEWPPLDRGLTLDCVILRHIPNIDGEGGCRPVFRIFGQDPFLVTGKAPKLLYSTPKRSKYVRYYKQKECELVKIDISCHVQGDVVVECINLSDKEREKMILRVVFNTAFIRSNILMLNRDDIDILWDAKEQFPKEFRAEILFSEMDAASSITSTDHFSYEEKEGLPIEAFSKVQEMFSNVDWPDSKSDVSSDNEHNMVQQTGAAQEKLDSDGNSSVDISPWLGMLSPRRFLDGKKFSVLSGSPRIPSPKPVNLKTLVLPKEKSSLASDTSKEAKPQDQQDNQSIVLAKVPSKDSTPMSSPGSAVASTAASRLTTHGKEEDGVRSVAPDKSPHAKEEPVVRTIPPTTPPPPNSPRFEENQTSSGIPTDVSQSLEESLARRLTTPPEPRTPSTPLSNIEDGKDGTPPVSPPPVRAESPVAPPPPPMSPSKENAASTSAPPPTTSPSAPPPPPPPPPPPTTGSSSADSAPPPPPPPPPITSSSSAPPPPPPPITSSSSAPPPPPPPGPALASKADGGPSAPAPPPLISSTNSKNRLLSRRNDQNKKLKPLHWLKLSRAVQGSLWAEAQKTGEASKAPEIDMSELENLFSAAAPNTDRKPSSRTPKGPKIEKVQLIDHRRAYNCEIMLSKVKVPLSDLMDSLLALEDSALDVDQVDNLIKFCPTKEEMELLKGYTGDTDKLGKCEQFFLELMKVPRVESKLRVFSFKIQFRSQVSDLRRSLNVVNSTADEIRNSIKLKRIMQTILSLGNALNQGTARGAAIGFKLDSLLKLTDTRARNNRMTLMHYLCKVLADKLPVVLDFSNDVSSLEPAARIQLKYLAEEMQAISKGLEKVVQELSSSENDGPVSDNFREKLKEFLCLAESEVRSLASLYSGVGRNVDSLILYFGEDPARCSFEQVTSTLLNFVRMFNKAHDENCKQLEQEMKKSAEDENLKMNSSQNESKNILQTSIKSNSVK